MRELRASVGRCRGGTLHVAFRLEGELSRIRLPPMGAAREGARLWEHTCFELFVALDGEPAYHELNVASSGECAIYAFRHYREPGAPPGCRERAAPEISERRGDESFELEVRLLLSHLSLAYANARLRVGLSAVVESREGRLSYWALHHPRESPDFHHPDAFALRLEPPPARC